MKITAAPLQFSFFNFCPRLAGSNGYWLNFREKGHLLAQVHNFVKIAAVQFGNGSILHNFIIIHPRAIKPENQHFKDFIISFSGDRENGHAITILKTDYQPIFSPGLPEMDQNNLSRQSLEKLMTMPKAS